MFVHQFINIFLPNFPAPFIPIATANAKHQTQGNPFITGTNLLTYDNPTGEIRSSPWCEINETKINLNHADGCCFAPGSIPVAPTAATQKRHSKC
jgi:hypothetical protein